MSKTRAKQDVEKALSNKGFRLARTTNHKYYIFHTMNDQKTRIKTMTSFGHKPKDIGRELLSAMAKQCKLTNDQFLDFVDCPLSRESYEQILSEKDLL
jgi:predicted RNA binding protein YcfA (HicA-like mRNA interferase family)